LLRFPPFDTRWDFTTLNVENISRQEGLMEKDGGISREDFLKGVGAGLGAVALGGIMGGQASAAQGEARKYIVAITNGGNNPNRAVLALLMALTAQDKGFGSVHV
jgi:hypothetical protein